MFMTPLEVQIQGILYIVHPCKFSFQQEPEKLPDSLMHLGAAGIKATLVEKYNSSKYATKTRSRIRQIFNTAWILNFNYDLL